MSKRWTRLMVASLVSLMSIVAFAGPASAAGESVGSCVAEKFEQSLEGYGDDDVLALANRNCQTMPLVCMA